MVFKQECLSYLELEKTRLIEEFPKYQFITEELLLRINKFINIDFDGISENKIYRMFLGILKDITYYALDNRASKSYMRSVFKILNNKIVIQFFTSIMKSKAIDIPNIMERFVNFFVYWQNSDKTKEQKREEIIEFVDGWM